MLLHSDPSFTIYFGDKQDVLVKPGFNPKQERLQKDHFYHEGFAKIQQNLHLESLVFLEQVHGDQGACIDEHATINEPIEIFDKTGDMVISNRRAVGIGVLTGDCLPVILYDSSRHVVAIIHAGWRGSIEQIVPKTIAKMIDHYKCQPKNMTAYLGPSAKICCYEVQPDFLVNLERFSYADKVIRKKDKLYLDVPLMNKIQMIEAGIRPTSIKQEYNVCTICNHSFHSYRRDGINAGRQATVVYLK